MQKMVHKIGLIINPVAGIGGRVGLKGSDGIEIVKKAVSMGGEPVSPARAKQTLSKLSSVKDELEIGTYSGEMGERVARECGFNPTVLRRVYADKTSAEDTMNAAADLRNWGAELIIFAGGDGTARDIASSIDRSVPVIGIPAGVKIYSGVFAANPSNVAEIVFNFIRGETTYEDREVLDIDEEEFRNGVVRSRLYGYMSVPVVRGLIQQSKIGSRYEPSTVRGVAFGVLNEMEEDEEAYYILGPGTTVKAVADELHIEKTLLGVDICKKGALVGKDLGEREIYSIINGHHAKIVVTPIGGQGYIFGRGNQQLSPKIIKYVGRKNIIVVSTMDKLLSLDGPLRVDTGDEECDKLLKGYIKVITGPRDFVIWEVV
ncbi:MAG: ATP-NAD kinase family protein [Candidatus Micrarchaeaceae archaeon]